jgi:hypothetical protein
MFDKQMLIKEATKYELKWFLDQQDDCWLEDLTDFFVKGGFNNWSYEDLEEKYRFQIKGEENA